MPRCFRVIYKCVIACCFAVGHCILMVFSVCGALRLRDFGLRGFGLRTILLLGLRIVEFLGIWFLTFLVVCGGFIVLCWLGVVIVWVCWFDYGV